MLVLTFNKHRYEVTDAINKELVGIHIYHDEDFNYSMDQERMLTSIVQQSNITGDKDEKLPYRLDGPARPRPTVRLQKKRKENARYILTIELSGNLFMVW